MRALLFGGVSQVGFFYHRCPQMRALLFGGVSQVGFFTADVRRLTQMNTDAGFTFWRGVRGWFF